MESDLTILDPPEDAPIAQGDEVADHERERLADVLCREPNDEDLAEFRLPALPTD